MTNPLDELKNELTGILNGLRGNVGVPVRTVQGDLDESETRLAELLDDTGGSGWASERFQEALDELEAAQARVEELEGEVEDLKAKLEDLEP